MHAATMTPKMKALQYQRRRRSSRAVLLPLLVSAGLCSVSLASGAEPSGASTVALPAVPSPVAPLVTSPELPDRLRKVSWPALLEAAVPESEAAAPAGEGVDLGVWRSLGETTTSQAVVPAPGVTASFASDEGRLVVGLWVSAGAKLADLPITVEGLRALERAANGNALARVTSGDVVLIRPGAVQATDAGPVAILAQWATAEDGGLRLALGAHDDERTVVVRFEVLFPPQSTAQLDRNGDGRLDLVELTAATAAAAPAGPLALAASKTAALAADADGDRLADPGDALRYTVTVSASAATAPGLTFDDTLDANTTLVPASTNVSPLALDDDYSTLGNVRLSVVDSLRGFLHNDREFLGDAFVLTSPVPGAATPTTAGGSVTVQADGTFVYDPPAGFRGPTDSFTYSLSDGRGLTAVASSRSRSPASSGSWTAKPRRLAPGPWRRPSTRWRPQLLPTRRGIPSTSSIARAWHRLTVAALSWNLTSVCPARVSISSSAEPPSSRRRALPP